MRSIILTLINFAFDGAYILIVIRAFLTYLPHNRYHPIIKPAYDLTEPLLSTIRKGLPPSKIGMDASPFIAIILLYLLQQVLLKTLSLI
ncbi:MAG: YggT family protein [bacterium]